MIATWKQYEGQAVDGIALLRLLGGSEASAVYLGELGGSPCAIKLAPAEEATAQIPLARWQQASKLSHPHLSTIHQWGRAKLNGGSYVYLAMEFAEEVLASVDRPLTPKEIREMLTPAVNALIYLHSQKFAHGRVHPSNILSVNEVLKISGDSPLRVGEKHPARPQPSPYDAPELSNVGVSALGDVWSLGVVLVEALTRQLPRLDEDSPKLPASLKPDSFREVILGCLQRDTARRWSMNDVSLWLERGVTPMPKKPPRRYLVPAGIAAGVLVVGAVVWTHSSGSSSASSPSTVPAVASTTTASPAAPAEQAVTQKPVEVPPLPAAKPAPVPKPEAAEPEAAEPDRAPAPPPTARSRTKAAPPDDASVVPSTTPVSQPQPTARQTAPSPADSIPDDVLQPVHPNVPSKSVATIRGKVPIFVRVEADASGAVTGASIESGKSSSYFAGMALQAAKQWKFAPGDASRAWLVRFEFVRDTQHPVVIQASRVK